MWSPTLVLRDYMQIAAIIGVSSISPLYSLLRKIPVSRNVPRHLGFFVAGLGAAKLAGIGYDRIDEYQIQIHENYLAMHPELMPPKETRTYAKVFQDWRSVYP